MLSIGPNIGLALATGASDLRVDPHLATSFVVEIEGVLAGGFSEVSGLSVQMKPYEYQEGGENGFVHRFVGPADHPMLVLKHGLSPIDGLWSWHQDVIAGIIKRRNGTIYLLDRKQMPVMWWDFTAALPMQWNGPSLNAAPAAIAFESVELAHHGLSRPQSRSPLDSIAGELAANVRDLGGFF